MTAGRAMGEKKAGIFANSTFKIQHSTLPAGHLQKVKGHGAGSRGMQ
jgi:hypothetical protein